MVATFSWKSGDASYSDPMPTYTRAIRQQYVASTIEI